MNKKSSKERIGFLLLFVNKKSGTIGYFDILDMDPQIDIKDIEDIMWLEDEEFETAVKQLDLRSILCLMEALQTSMCEEQLQFEQLTRQLQKYPDRNSYNHRKISTALCTTQSLLTNLCTKHMICSGQFGEESDQNTVLL
ncbi:hypothetical protein HNY73_005361 [Argiope bruennichi]|uniref:Uncharacterized protein n=1 Tax=Argiope bruennichi TaxID=94029 RepID=A0A8T0FJC2_ARGBR|nr:hypothetical protein HNY73_005361 [Argiope bruennichi]